MTEIGRSKLEAELKIFVTRFALFYINCKSVQLNTVFFGSFTFELQITRTAITRDFEIFTSILYFLENVFGIILEFSFPWSNLLPTRWGKNQLTPSQWRIGCRLPKWCVGGSILTK